jgi:hypothetical protein
VNHAITLTVLRAMSQEEFMDHESTAQEFLFDLLTIMDGEAPSLLGSSDPVLGVTFFVHATEPASSPNTQESNHVEVRYIYGNIDMYID